MAVSSPGDNASPEKFAPGSRIGIGPQPSGDDANDEQRFNAFAPDDEENLTLHGGGSDLLHDQNALGGGFMEFIEKSVAARLLWRNHHDGL